MGLDFAVARLRAFNKDQEKRGEAVMLMAVAGLQVELKDISGALSSLTRAPALFLSVGDKPGEAHAWSKLAQVHFANKEPGLALRAAEEALGAFQKVGDKKGKARAAMTVADACFSLAPYGQGNARKAVSAAQEAVAVYEGLGDTSLQALAIQVLANAQIMAKASEDAKRNAAKAEEMYQEVGDRHGQAGALLIMAGAHLGEGEFPEARERAREARELFKSIRDDAGEDGVEDFLADLQEYETGKRKKGDFLGFSMGAQAPTRASDRPRRRKNADAKVDLSKSDVEMFTWGQNNERLTIQFFDHFESRAARAPAPKASKAESGASMEKSSSDKTQVLYSVRWIRSGASAASPPSEEGYTSAADKRVSMFTDMGQPKAGVGRTGPTNRMLFDAPSEMAHGEWICQQNSNGTHYLRAATNSLVMSR